MDERMIREVVAQVLSEIEQRDTVRDYDPASGVMSINGANVELEKFDTGNPGDKVWVKDVITADNNKNIAAGYMRIEESEFPWTFTYDEIDYIIEGELTVKVNGKEIVAKPGDMMLIPKGTRMKWCAKNFAKFVFITYPADWADTLPH